jgi:hypothetical protein
VAKEFKKKEIIFEIQYAWILEYPHMVARANGGLTSLYNK